MKPRTKTTTPSFTYAEIEALNPCTETFQRITTNLGGKWEDKITARAAVKAGATLSDLIWVVSALGDKDIESLLRLWSADCAAHVLHLYEREYPTDMRPRDAIKATRQFTRGQIDDAARAAAWAAAGDAAGDAWDAGAAEEKWQLERFIMWFSGQPPKDWPLPRKPRKAKS